MTGPRGVTPGACPDPHPHHADGVLCAAALQPDHLSRNRYFSLFADPAFRRAHARAQSLRSLARCLRARHGRDVRIEPHGDRAHLVYCDEEIALTRRVDLDQLELSVLRVLVAAATQLTEPLRAVESDHQRVREALQRSGLDPDATGASPRH